VKTVFLDRDGTLNRERGFVARAEDLEVLPGAREAVAALGGAGFRLVVLTNQSGIARGLYTEADLARVHEALDGALGHLPAAYLHCPHHPDFPDHPYGGECTCRKPKTGLLHQAGRLFGSAIDWESSYLVGDSARDLWCGQDHPLTRILVKTGKPWREHLTALETGHQPPHHVAKDLGAAVTWILARS
jgi:D-glycero-D-manno-heptose 1,7-bisphosphate phosphatase